MVLKKYEKFISIVEDKLILETTIQNPNLSIVMPGGCNGKCDFCFWKKTKPCNNYLEKLNDIMYGLPSQFSQLSITGGEPTLSPYLEDVLNLIDKNIYSHTVLTSNGAKLLDFVPKLEGKIDHVNISRHHFEDEVNDSIFKAKMLTKEQLKEVSNELNKVGIDVTFSAVLSEKLNTKEDIEKYLQFAKENGASQVFFRKPHGTLDPTEVEKSYENYKSNEYSCPVCRTRVQKIGGINVSWKASLEEPSKELGGTIYELIVNENAEVTKDWEGKMKVDYNKINEKYQHIFEDCGGDTGGCGSSSDDYSNKSGCGSEISSGCGEEEPKKKRRKKKKLNSCGSEVSGGCTSESLVVESCGGSYGGCGRSYEEYTGPFYLSNDKVDVKVKDKTELKKVLKKFKLKKLSESKYSLPISKIQEVMEFLDFIRDVQKYNL